MNGGMPRMFHEGLERGTVLDGAVNRRDLSTGETGEFVGENVRFGLNLGG
jgi:hypothetical protein